MYGSHNWSLQFWKKMKKNGGWVKRERLPHLPHPQRGRRRERGERREVERERRRGVKKMSSLNKHLVVEKKMMKTNTLTHIHKYFTCFS